MGAQGPDELLQATLCAQRAGLLSASRGQGAKSWLRSSMRSEDGTEALLQQLQQHILEDSFLLQLRHNAEHPTPPIPGAGELASHEVLSSDWWSISDVENKELVIAFGSFHALRGAVPVAISSIHQFHVNTRVASRDYCLCRHHLNRTATSWWSIVMR
jgi:hypothetical protein